MSANDIVLIDSSDEEDYTKKSLNLNPRKVQKISKDSSVHKYLSDFNKESSKGHNKAVKSLSSDIADFEDEDEDEDEEEEDDGDDSKSDIDSKLFQHVKQQSENSDLDTNFDSEKENLSINGKIKGYEESSHARVSEKQYFADVKNPNNSNISQPSTSLSSDDDSSVSDDSLEEISLSEFQKQLSEDDQSDAEDGEDADEKPNKITVTKEECSTARGFLKREGSMRFLDKYLPGTATDEDILHIMALLGYTPKDIPDSLDGDNLIQLIKYLQRAMNIVLSMRARIEGFNTVDQVCEAISNAKNIIVVTGAGISTSLGIPDFRSAKGIYSQVQHLGLSDPQEVFDISVFKSDPTIFYSVAHMILPADLTYTPLHSFIKMIQDKGKLLRNYTQNIDNLESNAGIFPDKLVQCHGSFASASCSTCKYQVKGEAIFSDIRNKKLPVCGFCKPKREKLFNSDKYVRNMESYGIMKPDITFFGEDLPERFHDSIKEDLSRCDLLICIGTSLKVAPVSNIVNMVPYDIHQILINKDLVDHCEFDVSLLGYCDQVATYLANKLGWKLNHKDFQKIKDSNLVLVDKESSIGIYEIKDENQIKNESEEIASAKSSEPSDGIGIASANIYGTSAGSKTLVDD